MQDENLLKRYWIPYMCIKNQEVLSTTKVTDTDENKILVKLDYEKFLQDMTLNVTDIKDRVAGFSY